MDDNRHRDNFNNTICSRCNNEAIDLKKFLYDFEIQFHKTISKLWEAPLMTFLDVWIEELQNNKARGPEFINTLRNLTGILPKIYKDGSQFTVGGFRLWPHHKIIKNLLKSKKTDLADVYIRLIERLNELSGGSFAPTEWYR